MLTCALSVHSEFQLTLKKTVQGIKADKTRLFVSTGIAVNSVVFRRLVFCQFPFIDQLQKKNFHYDFHYKYTANCNNSNTSGDLI